MGGRDGAEDEKPVHQVVLNDFLIGEKEITQGQWYAVMGNNPSYNRERNSDELPVENVSWEEAMKFCDKLSEKAKRIYTLPTESQWEYACRAGGAGRWCFGDDARELGKYVWYASNSEQKTHPVGTKSSNTFGLYDMHGNVWEWCLDFYDEKFYGSPDAMKIDPCNTNRGTFRVIRGGAWSSSPDSCCSSNRHSGKPDEGSGVVGFRVVIIPFYSPD